MRETLEGGAERIQGKSFLFYCLCFRSKQRLDFKKKLDRAATQIEKSMDLGKFIRRQRQLTLAFLSMLSGQQTHLVTKMSALTIQDREGSSKFSDNDQGSSSEDQGDQKKRECIAERFATKVSQSANKVD